jgi:peroxin-6
MYRARTWQRAVVEPIPPILLRRLEQPSSSKQPTGQTAYASKDLFTALVASQRRQRKVVNGNNGEDDEERIGVAVTWPKESRLVDKGKGREGNLVIWVIPVFYDVSLLGSFER